MASEIIIAAEGTCPPGEGLGGPHFTGQTRAGSGGDSWRLEVLEVLAAVRSHSTSSSGGVCVVEGEGGGAGSVHPTYGPPLPHSF